MIQKDYYLRMIEEFGRALANFMERRHDAARRDREMADLYRQYVGDYTLVRNLSLEETMVYAHDQWADDERIGRLGMLAELLYAEATYCAVPISTLLYDKAQPAPELSVFVLDTADHSWAADAASLYEDMKAVEREYDLHCGLQQLFTQADGCAVPAYRADSGYDFALLAADGASVYVSGLQAQLAAALCGQTGRFFTAFAGGQAVCDTRVNVTAEDTTVQLHLRDTDFQPLGAYNEDWQALLCTELQQAFSALTADDAADFFHLQFWHVNLWGPGSALPVPRLEILFE